MFWVAMYRTIGTRPSCREVEETCRLTAAAIIIGMAGAAILLLNLNNLQP